MSVAKQSKHASREVPVTCVHELGQIGPHLVTSRHFLLGCLQEQAVPD